MSSYVPYSLEARRKWIDYILSLYEILISVKTEAMLSVWLSQIYEFCIWASPREKNKPLKLRMLEDIHAESVDWNLMCDDLYKIRNVAVHRPFQLNTCKQNFYSLFGSQQFTRLLEEFFGNDAKRFEELLQTYARFINE